MTYNAEQITYMLAEAIDQDREYKSWHVSTRHLMALVERVVAEEREACANLCDEKHYLAMADAIRARGHS